MNSVSRLTELPCDWCLVTCIKSFDRNCKDEFHFSDNH